MTGGMVQRALVNSEITDKAKASGLVRCMRTVRDANFALHNRHLPRRLILIRRRLLDRIHFP
jgi:hypothetical protein